MENLDLSKALEIYKSHCEGRCFCESSELVPDCYQAKGFISGWEAAGKSGDELAMSVEKVIKHWEIVAGPAGDLSTMSHLLKDVQEKLSDFRRRFGGK